ncbi:Bug family tripartite tricarboxylate transporter substrate binding protein [uncultured Enterovirga sp.]|uniref:Bug family tripartite tricarboxylate transporter substrate binding protein n=1 Tax=uncultured Enterovirga sp. TaxID=2026352 RepID=UPI0035CAF222
MIRILAGALALAVSAFGALSQEWPSRPVRIIVPFGPGSTPDGAARVIADRLQARLGQPFVIENKAGAGGNLGTDAVAKAQPDGYTIGVSIVGPLALNTLLFPRMPYDPFRDLTPVTILGAQPSVLVVNNDLPARRVEDLVALLRRDPGRYNFASIGIGSLSHLAMEAIAMRGATRPVHIPFAGSPAAVTALIRGDVHMSVLPAGSVVAQAEAGQIRMLAVTAARRSPLLPDVPTLRELGIAGVEADAWIGLIAPAGLPDPILDKLGATVRDILAEPATRDRLRTQLISPDGGSAADFRAVVQAELERWGPVIRANDIRVGQ